MSLSTPQIAAQIERLLASDPATVALAIRARTRQPWPGTLSQRGRQFALRWCESSLAIREALCDLEQQDPATAGLVVLTPLATHEIAEDIAARLARARVFQPEGWDIVRQLFQARETDARLGRFAWMPQCLIDAAAQGPYPPVANGFLGLETAWQEVLQRFLRIPAARPDAVALLNWSMTAGAEATLDQLPVAARADVMRWLGEAAGSAGEMVLGCVESGRTADALPLGLVCGVIFAPQGEGQAALGQAAIRLERYVDDRHVGVTEGRAWARAAEQVVRAAGLEATRVALDRADALLRDLRVAQFAHLSDLLPAALDQRLQDFALALSAHVAEPTEANLAQVESQADRALEHTLMASQPPRAERVAMARRLARWLLTAPRAATSLADAAAWQADEGAFVDWARFRLLGGDEIPELSQAYGACREALIDRRNRFARPFAQALIEWNANQPSVDGRLVPVESVLEQVVAPIAATHPILLLVIDGLSMSIFRELFARSARHGWAEMVPGDLGQPLLGVAALPTVTEVSRASLLCGRLALGAAAQERAGFASHPALLAHSRVGVPPRLFHKGDLADASNLAPEVRAAIANPHQRVLGVVYNAVDDHLSGPDQLHQRWTLEDLRLLLPLLREAREARRVVVITADHGHLLEDGTTQVGNGGDSDRWRPGTGGRAPHELAVSGGRVVTSDGSNAVVCLWGESTRYGGRKNGYHGGLSPQEVTVPLAVIVPLGLNLPGWTPAPPAQPEWWELPPIPKSGEAKPAVSQPGRPSGHKPSAQAGQPQLFEESELPPARVPAAADWISALLSGPIYASQRQLAARVALPDEQMRALLSALSERGGKLSRAALAQRLSLPDIRLGGMLSAVRRLLNVDQAPVLVIDEAAGTVELNIALLHQQFRLGGQGIRR
ncbi:BREX-2 system phosphatase PglZ [Accumulibacter sp.]|uniref:BREX-2 system phosphatase PglZ n=1 Tax=Accumulibacter sp. TaxID=2053492 RepID=UPI0025DD0A76|nr:BREX-2 system phosphatase PglZ [Accumulibacter sp.]MCM8596146.1 BREX-2 system phosphatase PglZ [Accumulibacter sp.]MCM8625580.1 BREX-2 system phosphatase PglZ [Accumulibacter sp.]MDS4050295.1 BREX-2 system phosphatase PglZ [Accumulibacter sp.]